MQCVEIIHEVLKTGVLPIAVERQLLHRLLTTPVNPQEKMAIAQLTEALQRGMVHRSPEISYFYS